MNRLRLKFKLEYDLDYILVELKYCLFFIEPISISGY